jgi:hypothetical protein
MFSLARDGITINGSRGDLMGLTGPSRVGLVDLLLVVEEMGDIGEVACRRDAGASSERGLCSNAWMILFAVFMERETDWDWDDGGTGMTGSLGSGKVLERFLGNECGTAGFLANALGGGEIGTRFGARGRWGEPEDVGSGLVRFAVSKFGDVRDDLPVGETGVGGSILIFETVRVCDKGCERFKGGEEETGGCARARLAAVGLRTLLLANGTVGLLRKDWERLTLDASFGGTTGVTVRLAGALLGGTGGGCASDGGLGSVGLTWTAAGADADGLCLEKIEKGLDLFDTDAVDVEGAGAAVGFVGERRAGKRERASCSLL